MRRPGRSEVSASASGSTRRPDRRELRSPVPVPKEKKRKVSKSPDERSRRRQSPGSSSQRGGLALELVGSSASTKQLPSTPTITIRTIEMQMIIDSIRRAAANVRNAEQLCERAAQAFRSEATALESAHAALLMNLVHR